MCKLVTIDDNPMEHLNKQTMCELFKDAAHSQGGRLITEFFEGNQSRPGHLPDIKFPDLNKPQFCDWQFLDQFEILYPSLEKNINFYIISSSIDHSDKLTSELYPSVKYFFQTPIKTEYLEQ